MSLNELLSADWVFKGLLSGLSIFAVKILIHLKTSIDQINISLAKISERHEWHNEKIKGLQDDFKELQRDYYQTREFLKKVF